MPGDNPVAFRNRLPLCGVKTAMNGYVCSGTGEKLCLPQLTLHGATSLKASEPIDHCRSNTHFWPTEA